MSGSDRGDGEEHDEVGELGDDEIGELSDAEIGEQPHAADVADEEESWDVSLADLEDDPEPERIEPGSPSPEHVIFVLLGILLTLAVIYRLVDLVGAMIA